MQSLQAACESNERISRAFYREALNLALEAVNARGGAGMSRNLRREPVGPRRRAKTSRRAAEKKSSRG